VGLTVVVASTSKNYGAALPTLTASSVTGLVNGDTVGTTITIGLSTTATAASSVSGGPYPITATVGGSASGNYTLTNTPGLLTINPVGLTVTVASTSKNYGAALPTLTASSVTGLVNGDTVGTTITIGLSTTATAASSVSGGPYPITATVGGSASGNYTLTNAPGLLTINPVALTVTAASTSKNYGAALPTLTASSVTGLVNGDTVGTTITISLSTTATAASSVAAVPIRSLRWLAVRPEGTTR